MHCSPYGQQDSTMITAVQGKAKRKAWQKVVDEGLSKEDAQKKYISLVESLKEKHGYEG